MLKKLEIINNDLQFWRHILAVISYSNVLEDMEYQLINKLESIFNGGLINNYFYMIVSNIAGEYSYIKINLTSDDFEKLTSNTLITSADELWSLYLAQYYGYSYEEQGNAYYDNEIIYGGVYNYQEITISNIIQFLRPSIIQM